ncbi:MAG: hypothetical protein AB8B53_06875, partial [Flavobacteriales bacterium]
MKFWIFFGIALLILLAFKGYISRGVYQASGSKMVQMWYTVFSVGTFIIGVTTMAVSFPKGIMSMSLAQNLV